MIITNAENSRAASYFYGKRDFIFQDSLNLKLHLFVTTFNNFMHSCWR